MAVEEVYIPDVRAFELRPFEDRVLELVRLFEQGATVRLRIVGTIAAGAPLEAVEEPESVVELHGPEHLARRHPALPQLRAHLCPALQSLSADAFEIARAITPLLAGLKLSGKVPIDLDPWLFAGVSILIARAGIAAFCAEESANGTAEATSTAQQTAQASSTPPQGATPAPPRPSGRPHRHAHQAGHTATPIRAINQSASIDRPAADWRRCPSGLRPRVFMPRTIRV